MGYGLPYRCAARLVRQPFALRGRAERRWLAATGAGADVVTATALAMAEEPERFQGVTTPAETLKLDRIKPRLKHVVDFMEPDDVS